MHEIFLKKLWTIALFLVTSDSFSQFDFKFNSTTDTFIKDSKIFSSDDQYIFLIGSENKSPVEDLNDFVFGIKKYEKCSGEFLSVSYVRTNQLNPLLSKTCFHKDSIIEILNLKENKNIIELWQYNKSSEALVKTQEYLFPAQLEFSFFSDARNFGDDRLIIAQAKGLNDTTVNCLIKLDNNNQFQVKYFNYLFPSVFIPSASVINPDKSITLLGIERKKTSNPIVNIFDLVQFDLDSNLVLKESKKINLLQLFPNSINGGIYGTPLQQNDSTMIFIFSYTEVDPVTNKNIQIDYLCSYNTYSKNLSHYRKLPQNFYPRVRYAFSDIFKVDDDNIGIISNSNPNDTLTGVISFQIYDVATFNLLQEKRIDCMSDPLTCYPNFYTTHYSEEILHINGGVTRISSQGEYSNDAFLLQLGLDGQSIPFECVDSHMLIRPVNQWTVQVQDATNGLIESYRYSFDSLPKLINDFIYYELLVSDKESRNDFEGTGQFFREKENKVFKYADNGDVLYYDYNLNIGDTYELEDNNKIEVVAKKQVTLLNGEERSVTTFECPTGERFDIVDGLVGEHGIESFVNACLIDGIEITSCFYEKDELIYQWNDECWVVNTNEVEHKNSIFPNPAMEFINFGNRVYEQVNIFDKLGQIIRRQQPMDNKLYIGDLAPGLYYLRAQHRGDTFQSVFIKQ